MVTEDEIRLHESWLTTRLEANQRRTCPRPELRGHGVFGPASIDIAVLDKPADALAACLADLQALADAEGGLAPLVDQRRPDLVAIDRRCGAELATIVERSARRSDGCSPYLVGVRVEPAAITRHVQVAHVVALRARMLADRDPKAGMWLALDLVRFGQDLGRSAPLLVSALGNAVAEIAIESARTIAAQRKLSRADLDLLAHGVGELLLGEPSVASTLAAEVDQVRLHLALAPNQPDGWTPPGGWPDGKRTAREAAPAALHPRDVAAMFFVVGDILAARVAEACPDTSSLTECEENLGRQLGPDPTASGDLVASYAALRKAVADVTDTTTVAEVRHRIRSEVGKTLTVPFLASFHTHVARRGAAVARLASLGHHLEVEKVIARTRACPNAAELASPPFARVAAPLGDTVTATLGAGPRSTITLAPPSWVRRAPVAYTIVCP